MSDNWVVQNLQNALDTWNKYLSEIWQLITQSPEQFKGGSIWSVIVNIHDAVRAIGLALLVLFFVIGIVKTCGSFAEVKKPEHALKLFIRFAIAKGVVTYGLELMMALFNIVQGLVSTIMNAAGFGTAQQTVLPQEIIDAVESCGFFESIPLWAVTLIGGLFITVLSFIMIMTVWVCILGAAPFAMLGFITYHGMTAEQFIWAWLRSEMLEPKEIKFEDGNYYYAALKDVIEGRPVRKQPKEPKQFHKRKEATHD